MNVILARFHVKDGKESEALEAVRAMAEQVRAGRSSPDPCGSPPEPSAYSGDSPRSRGQPQSHPAPCRRER